MAQPSCASAFRRRLSAVLLYNGSGQIVLTEKASEVHVSRLAPETRIAAIQRGCVLFLAAGSPAVALMQGAKVAEVQRASIMSAEPVPRGSIGIATRIKDGQRGELDDSDIQEFCRPTGA
jgi:hypothetical protein